MKRITLFLLLFYDVIGQCDDTFYDGLTCTYDCDDGFFKNPSNSCEKCTIGNRNVFLKIN